MRWSKVRKLFRESFAESVRERVDVRITNADPRGTPFSDWCTAGWFVVDGHVVAHFEPHSLRTLTLSLPVQGQRGHQIKVIVQPRPEQKVPLNAEAGEFLDLHVACWEYLHSSLDDSLRHTDPFVSSLAVLNAKVGKQRLRRMANWDLHPLTRAMVEFRLDAETGRVLESEAAAT